MNYQVRNIYDKIKNNRVFVSVPGSKSITARALLISAIADGESTLYGAQFSDDCRTFINCLTSLGIDCKIEGTTVRVRGYGGRLKVKKGKIDVGSAGTAARFLPAFLAFQEGEFTLSCSEQMKNRPIAPLINTLKELGARFEFLEKENSYPFKITGTRSPNTNITTNISESSQFLSALLISSACAKRPVRITALGEHGLGYVDMTTNIMWSFGLNVKTDGNNYTVSGKYFSKKYDIEPDVSAACYFYALNRILGTDVRVRGIMPRSMQSDMKFIELIKNFDGGKVNMGEFSDQALTLAAIAPYFKGTTEICGISHIRYQECDRINAIISNLSAMGVKCEELPDGVKIYPSAPKPAKINTFGDHRVAMSFALTGLRADGIVIENAEVCSKTFKEYFEVLDGVCEELTN